LDSVEKETWNATVQAMHKITDKFRYKIFTKAGFCAKQKAQRLFHETLVKVIKIQIEKQGSFYGLKV